ncbi:hypothetical protein FHR83_007491 [Actinoplanes campanulatus]|uniref:DUF397 domain-containing protein n=1 Tax=Actinoplanes campanulatus TaxID=113559 RepID=A0A7W5FIS9_9ACTN|nr:DUF397 domain-containing protein [Actinoplanes campanulatus]MBB3099775.1 hypothetical protein [Actinoplanes campanulatus]GGN47069.1 hypothetical protein GCM10010109_82930 [Actinoplanes campanulatus]GID42352.1 hypothetical protein Aca09nite_88580 [Actinoplanes campanulatus]
MPKDDLYSIEVPDEAFAGRCGGNGLTLEGCVSAAEIPGSPGTYAIRDTKLGEDSPTLRFSKQELDDFMASIAGDGDNA